MKHLGKLLPCWKVFRLVHRSVIFPELFVASTHYLIHLGEKRQTYRVEPRHTDLKFDVFLQLGHHTPKLDQYLSLIQNNGLNHICSLL